MQWTRTACCVGASAAKGSILTLCSMLAWLPPSDEIPDWYRWAHYTILLVALLVLAGTLCRLYLLEDLAERARQDRERLELDRQELEWQQWRNQS